MPPLGYNSPDRVSVSTTAGGNPARRVVQQGSQPGGAVAGRVPFRGQGGEGASRFREQRGGAHAAASLGPGVAAAQECAAPGAWISARTGWPCSRGCTPPVLPNRWTSRDGGGEREIDAEPLGLEVFIAQPTVADAVARNSDDPAMPFSHGERGGMEALLVVVLVPHQTPTQQAGVARGAATPASAMAAASGPTPLPQPGRHGGIPRFRQLHDGTFDADL